MIWSTTADDTKMLLDIPFPKKYITVDQLILTFVNICIDNTPQILCKSLQCFAKIDKIDYSKIAKNGL